MTNCKLKHSNSTDFHLNFTFFFFFKGQSSIKFHKVAGLVKDWFKKIVVKICAAKIFRRLVSSMGQAPKALVPTLPIMQLDSCFH